MYKYVCLERLFTPILLVTSLDNLHVNERFLLIKEPEVFKELEHDMLPKVEISSLLAV